jgi:hypothetical protein
MSDPWKTQASPTSCGRRGVVLTPAEADFAVGVAKTVTTLTAGDVTLVPAANADGDTLAFVGLPAGWIAPFQVRRVTAATATVAAVFD